MKLLEETIRELKGEDIEDDARATVNLRVDLKIEESYIPDMNQRLMVYRRIASARTDDELDRTVAEVRDRYGPLPGSVLNLADYGRIRVAADRLGVEAVDREGDRVVFRFRPRHRSIQDGLVQVVGRRADLTLVPPAGLRLDLGATAGKAAAPRGSAGPPVPAPHRPSGNASWPNLGRRPQTSSEMGKHGRAPGPGSWWTARATAGEVTAGFTKAEILRTGREDPRGPAGVFTRVGALLSELLGSV